MLREELHIVSNWSNESNVKEKPIDTIEAKWNPNRNYFDTVNDYWRNWSRNGTWDTVRGKDEEKCLECKLKDKRIKELVTDNYNKNKRIEELEKIMIDYIKVSKPP